MATDDIIEAQAYRAIRAVCGIIRPQERERILKTIVHGIMDVMNWETVTIKEPKDGL